MTIAAASTVALLLADARLPSGGHAHSAGMEPALLGGMPATDVAAFLTQRARTTALVDAGAAVAAMHAVLDGDGRGLAPVERAWSARTASSAMRETSRELGRGLLRLARRIWPSAHGIGELGEAPPRPLVLGVIAAEVEMTAEELVRLAVYDDLASAVAALLKLEPRDPAEGVTLVLQACASVEPAVASIAAIWSPDDIPALSAPQAEAWAERHATTPRRLFRG
ncbi:urease accessory protein [Leifsonia sp. AK011]|uniref:urease accessory protein UreF n=1 Tax=Leifsonia sp. AK011 TaxID=2723075 RepID=UPI0015CAF5E8|nr:urease accessory UreF family protein [Leifsonia sp. AK011]NYF09038.1 urease accessory protein [Leifsonia sp. AK011]